MNSYELITMSKVAGCFLISLPGSCLMNVCLESVARLFLSFPQDPNKPFPFLPCNSSGKMFTNLLLILCFLHGAILKKKKVFIFNLGCYHSVKYSASKCPSQFILNFDVCVCVCLCLALLLLAQTQNHTCRFQLRSSMYMQVSIANRLLNYNTRRSNSHF